MISEIDLSKAIFGTGGSSNRFTANNAGGIKIGSAASGSSVSSTVRYGTCQTASADGKVTVLMDGSDEPIVVNTSETLQVGDRVSVVSAGGSYKAVALGDNTIGGNMVNVDEVFANKVTASEAVIQKLTANEAFIQKLTANTAFIDYLTANEAFIKKLSADEAFIKSLTATEAFITNLTANNAFIEKLTANEALITKLTSDEAFIKNLTANNAFVENLTGNEAFIGNIAASEVMTDKLGAKFVQVDQANINEEWVNKLMVQGSFISQNGTIYNLTGLHINAGDITTGTLTVDRIAVKSEVDGEYYMLTPNPEGGFTQVKLDGNIIQKDSINADRIIANSITTDQITTNNLVGTGGWINLANGTFKYSNAETGGYISWDGARLEMNVDKLTIGGSAIPSAGDFQDKIDEAKKYATNYLEYDSVNGLLVGNKSNGTWSGYRTKISQDGVDFLDGDNTSMSNFSSTARIGKADSKNVYIDSTAIQIRDGSTVESEFKGNTISLGKNSVEANVYMASECVKIGTSEPDQSGYRTVQFKGLNNNCRAIELIPYGTSTNYDHTLSLTNTAFKIVEGPNNVVGYFSAGSTIIKADSQISLSASNGSSYGIVGISGYKKVQINTNGSAGNIAISTLGSNSAIDLQSDRINITGTSITIQGRTLDDFIVDEGTSNSWRYKKYRNGTWEATYTTNTSCNTSNAWGGVFVDYNYPKGGMSWPFTIKTCSAFSITPLQSDGCFWAVVLQSSSTSRAPTFRFVSGAKYSQTVYYRIYAAGTY